MQGHIQNALRLFTRAMRPLALRSAGHEGSGTSVIRHVGRRSGRTYDTPVIAVRHDDSFLIALPYGKRTDWLKNVLGKGSATIVTKGHAYDVDRPEVIPMAEATGYFGTREQRMHRQFHVDTALQVRKRPDAHQSALCAIGSTAMVHGDRCHHATAAGAVEVAVTGETGSGGTMLAVVQHRYGTPDVLALADVAVPVPGEGQVLIKVRAAAISYPDCATMRGVPYLLRLLAGLRRPNGPIRGSDVAGTVVRAGTGVTGLEPGDEVFGWCARHGLAGGGFAEYASCPRSLLVRKPAGLSFEQAAALPTSGVTALQAIRDWARVKPGQHVLINGASGGVGSFAVQIAKTSGAEVTAVCGAANADFVRSIGADHVVDYTQQDFTRCPERYDVILDVPHLARHSLAALRRVLTSDGTLVPASNTPNRLIGGFSRVIPARVISPFTRQRILAPEARQEPADLAALAELVTSGQITPIISRTYPLAGTPEAMRHFASGHARGRLVITM